ncbi:cytochrome P450 [Mycolicibacterium goodii]|uniref:cytochrome P450 family protein n=1 Tax=Mycolicibacterium goodii TaxID=134601 RepID=UPI001BDCCCF9|nr:cytochrome P450 [Mycolicibacterium goodii]MBU8812042.1 cytochrome P450 [Mycolicibacterium goodii]
MIDNIILDEQFTQDPEELYRKLRSTAPVCEVELVGGVRGWLVTRYADAMALLKDPRVIKDHAKALPRLPQDQARPYSSPLLHRHMLNLDPPEHTRLRRFVVQAFTPRAVARMQPIIDAIADELLDDIDLRSADASVDLIAHYAEPLPIQVIGELLGVAMEYARPFRAAVTPLLTSTTHDEKADAEQTTVEILNDLIEQKTRAPGEDLLSAMIQASVDGGGLTHNELVSMCFLLIVAGYETTVNLIGNGTLALLNNPPQLDKVRADPELTANTIEEILRFDGPVNIATMRFTAADVDVDGVVIPANETVLISLLSANRDQARFDDADHFDVERNTRGHIAFGHGIHYCLGAPLARMEGITAIGRLIQRYDRISLDRTAELRYHNGTLMHGLKSLPVRLSGRR